MPQAPFINIHTHRKPSGNSNTVIRNAWLQRFEPTQKGYFLSHGIHPWHAQQLHINRLENLLRSLLVQPKTLAVGEIGLDRLKPGWDKQLQLFDRQLQLAAEFDKPAVVHCVKAYPELIPFVKKTRIPMILHGYNGHADQTRKFLEYEQVCFSFGPRELRAPAFIKRLEPIPVHRIFLETDTAAESIETVYENMSAFLQVQPHVLKMQILANFTRVCPSVQFQL